jgi:hypothetical protein
MTILSNSNSGTVMDVRIPGVVVESAMAAGTSYDVVSLPGQTMAPLDVGRPQVPKLSYLLGIPDNAQVSVSVTVLESETLENINCYPYQKPARDDEAGTGEGRGSSYTFSSTSTFAVDQAFYAQNTEYPQLDARVVNTGDWRRLPVATIEVFPVKYNPGLRRLSVATRLRVEVNYSGGLYAPRTIEPWLARIYQTSVDNLGKLNLQVAWNDSPGVRYLVINCTKYQGSWLDSLVNWHQMQGVQTRVVTCDSWSSDVSVWDTIAREYYSHDPPLLRWVLLVGNQNEVPMHYYDDVATMSDYYYALMDSSGGSLYADIGIGRLYASSPSDLTVQVEKTLKYEKNPYSGNDWLTRVTLAANNDEYPDDYAASIRGIYNYPYGYYHYTFDTIQGGNGGTNAMVAADINQGRGIVNYNGHGDQIEWWNWDANSADWTAANISSLNNGDMTPVVINCCCENHDFSTSPCLGVSWMMKYPGGAVASLGATASAWTDPDHGFDSMLFFSLGDTMTVQTPGGQDYTCPTFDLGWVQNNADAYILNNYPGASYGGENAAMYLWLGDPALEVWSGGQPGPAGVDYPSAIPLGPNSLPVTVAKGGLPVQGALVCAWKGTEFYAVGHTDGNGKVTLDISPVTKGNFTVTVSGGHVVGASPTPILPFEGSCSVYSAFYVPYARYRIDDSPPGGNGDGIVNPTETVNLPLWVVNQGTMAGHNVTGILQTSDKSVTVTDSSRPLGTIPIGDSANTGDTGFAFHVADTCSNGHAIAFYLTTRDATDSTWTSSFTVVVGTAVLGYAGQFISDPPPGGNGDGWLDPGETAQLFVSLHNSGLGHGYHVTARLHSGNRLMHVRDSLVTYGAILRDSTKQGSSGFVVQVDSSMTPGTSVCCTLLLAGDDAFHEIVPFVVVVGQPQETDPIHDNVTPLPLYWAIDDSDLRYSGHPTFNWIEAHYQGENLQLGPDQTMPVTLPASFGPFEFYNQRNTLLSICSNGWLAPGLTASTVSTNAPLPTTTLPTAAICANWGALDPSSDNNVWFYQDTAAHAVVVEWDSVPYRNPPTTSDKFEVVIFDTTLAGPGGNNQIVVQYLTANGYRTTTAGIQDPTQVYGINCLYDDIYNLGTVPFRPGCAVKYTTIVPTVAIAEQPVAVGARRRLALTAGSPFRGAGCVRFTLPQATPARLLVYDVNGRQVRVLFDKGKTPVKPGSYELRWDGRRQSGAIAPEGVYFYRLETGLGAVSGKAVKVE